MTERKYAMTRVAAGDYILPSNDAATFWRIARYTDGPSFGLDPEIVPRDFTVWALWRCSAPNLKRAASPLDWDVWEHSEDGFETRTAAIERALNLTEEVAA